MIIEQQHEGIRDLSVEKVSLDNLIEHATDYEKGWEDSIVTGNRNTPLTLTASGCVGFLTPNGEYKLQNVTEHAFNQICQRVGVPAAYMKKCYDAGLGDLALQNYSRWNEEGPERSSVMVRSYNDEVHAVVTDRYSPFNDAVILEGVRDAVIETGNRFQANEAFLSPDKLHVRFVDFNNPLKIANDKLYTGFTLSSSNIGTRAFSIKYFIYRFACKNGIVRVMAGGVLFRQTHLSTFMEDPASIFNGAIVKMAELDEMATQKILAAQSKSLTGDALKHMLEKARRDLNYGIEGEKKVLNLLETGVYDKTLWGFINSVTETSKEYTLEDRVKAESWAGTALAAA